MLIQNMVFCSVGVIIGISFTIIISGILEWIYKKAITERAFIIIGIVLVFIVFTIFQHNGYIDCSPIIFK